MTTKPTSLSARRLNRATLARQLLLRRRRLGVVEGVGRIVAVQAQEAASPYLALWNRLAGFDPADLDAAYSDHSVVKATLMRITLHAVTASDYPAFHHAMASSLRASRLNDRRFAETGLSAGDADALLADVLAFTAQPRTNADMEAWLEDRLGRPAPMAWWALRTFAPVVRVPTGGPWSHGPSPAYVAARSAPPAGEAAASVAHLVRRYLEAFGPASAQDIAQFTILRQPVVRAALEGLSGDLEAREGPAGERLYDVPGAPLPGEDTPAPPRLMAMWDSCLLAYADRSRLIPPDYRPLIIRRNGDVLPAVLVDGYVSGVWRALDGAIEVTAFHTLPGEAWGALAKEARGLASFLAGRDPAVYRRYSRWWEGMPGQVRVLAG